MSEAAQAKSPAKKKPSKPKKPADHPPYSEMIKAAIVALKERGGSSRQAIEKYIKANYKVGEVGPHLKTALKRGVAGGKLVHTSKNKRVITGVITDRDHAVITGKNFLRVITP